MGTPDLGHGRVYFKQFDTERVNEPTSKEIKLHAADMLKVEIYNDKSTQVIHIYLIDKDMRSLQTNQSYAVEQCGTYLFRCQSQLKDL